ncbi:MAG TPA: hypothetical protein DDW52_00365, partial [Planctomycetaceae bacterium]|nr:hypothetical protein [Planctomycetaceae bacterium]
QDHRTWARVPRARKRNPSRWLMFPLSAICLITGLGATLNRIGDWPLSGPALYNFLTGCVVLLFGVVGILLSLTVYTAANRWLTVFWGVMAAKICFVSLFFEQPQSPVEFLVFTTIVMLVLSISVIALITATESTRFTSKVPN